jgi:phytoene dehydrogenase-like protein
VFGGDYGYVKGGIWKITSELGRLNQELGVELLLDCTVHEADANNGVIRYQHSAGARNLHFDHLVFGTDPQTAARLTGDPALIDHANGEQVLGTSGKLNLMFRKPVQWMHGEAGQESSAAFRYQFGDFENVSICGASTYPCGSVAGTPAYMCVKELLRQLPG